MSEQIEIITNKILLACEETCNELMEESTSEEKIMWLRHVLSSIETTNEQAEDDSGFTPIYTGPFKINTQEEDLNSQVKHLTNILVQTVLAANKSYKQKEVQMANELMNKNLYEISKDPVFCNYSIKELFEMTPKELLEKQMQTKIEKQIQTKTFRLRRMHWEGHLEEVLHMLETFEEKRDSDVESFDDEDM